MFEFLGFTVTWMAIVLVLELLCILGFLFAATAAEAGVGSLLIILIGAGIVHLTTPVNVVELLKSNAGALFTYAIFYAICGIVYTIVKFGKKIAEGKRLFDKGYDAYKSKHPEASQKDFINARRKDYGFESWLESVAPVASKNKRLIGFWAAWWPFCLLEFLYLNFFKNLAKYLANFIDVVYVPIKRKIYGELYDELKS